VTRSDSFFGGRARRRPSKNVRNLGVAVVLAMVGLALAVASATSSGWARTSYADRHPQTARVGAPVPGKLVPVSTHPRLRRQMPVPARIIVPAIGVNAPIIRLGKNRDGTVQVPRSFGDAGWFQPGPEPGEKGAAVIFGHVDSKSGPGVFYHLRALRRGDRIRIRLVTGEMLTFAVTGSKEASKNHFPTKLVYARTPNPTLRLVTCGGAFNAATGHYVDNYIVFARLLP
jgi:sortase (surface protein transpeptidase)